MRKSSLMAYLSLSIEYLIMADHKLKQFLFMIKLISNSGERELIEQSKIIRQRYCPQTPKIGGLD
jgi:hypothetical protein